MSYRTRCISVDVDVDMSNFSDDEIREEASERDLLVAEGSSGLPKSLEARLYTLILCGQREQALRELADHLAPFIGKLIL